MKTIWLYATQEEGTVWLPSLSVALRKKAFRLELVATDPTHSSLRHALQTAVFPPSIVLFMGATKEPALTQVSQICRSANLPVLYVSLRGSIFQIGPGTQAHSTGCLACWEWQNAFFYSIPPTATTIQLTDEYRHTLASQLAPHLQPYVAQQHNILQTGHYIQINVHDNSQQIYKFVVNATCPICSTWRWWPSETHVAAVF